MLHDRICDDASSVWAQYTGSRQPGYRRNNFLYNGGFETEPAPSPLDWKVSKIGGVDVRRDRQVAHSGEWSLRIDFLGKDNLNYSHISQTACVRPGRLRFRASVKTSGITTDQGPAFRVFDIEAPARLDLRTSPLHGDADWHPVELSFTVPPGTRLLGVQVVRSPSLKFDSKIAGTVWIDDVALEPRLPAAR